MGLISRVSSRTYRKLIMLKLCNLSFARSPRGFNQNMRNITSTKIAVDKEGNGLKATFRPLNSNHARYPLLSTQQKEKISKLPLDHEHRYILQEMVKMEVLPKTKPPDKLK